MSADETWNDERLLWMARVIDECGMAIISVGYGRCSHPGCRGGRVAQPWSYTIGLVEAGHPEVVTFGPTDHLAGIRLNWLRDLIDDDQALPPGTVARFRSTDVRLDRVPQTWVTDRLVDPMGHWFHHYLAGRPDLRAPEVLQLVWADRRGIFPDEPGCDPKVRRVQPVLADRW